MTLAQALEALRRFLCSLSPTGSKGFEGLVVALLEGATGQRFRLSASGQQHGQDASSEPGPGNRIKVEAKRYSAASLDLRELGSEIQQAAIGTGVDLWVLAASCALETQKADELAEIGRNNEMEILILDLGNDGLPRIAVLAAAHVERLEAWVAQHSVTADMPALKASLQTIAAVPQFSASRDQVVRKLNSTLLGYDDTRRRARKEVLRVLGDAGNSVASFNQNLGVADKNVRRVERSKCNAQFDQWWNSAKPVQRHAVTLGEEGTGKTWATMSWVAKTLESGRMPLVLPFCANAESLFAGDTIESLLARLLSKWTGNAAASWSKRLFRWFEDLTDAPLILVVADGLNEKPAVSWPSFFRTLNEEHWRRHVCVIATDRPGHWLPHCARSGLTGFQEIPIEGYTDAELHEALKGSGIDLGDIPHELLSLVRKPRYCDLVVTHYVEMKADSDFTVERLIFLDIKHRCAQKRGSSLTTDDFVEIISILARKYHDKATVTPSSLSALLPTPDPERQIYQEIMDGGLVVRIGPAVQLERVRLVYGLGMLLAEEIQLIAASVGTAQLEDAVSRWFEPHPEMDLKVEVCGSAIFHALMDSAYPSAGRRELLRYWLGLRNWADHAQEAFIDYVLRCPTEFLEILEDFWSSKRDRGAAQEFFARALIRHRDNPALQPALIKLTQRWMGFVHIAGHGVQRSEPDGEAKTRKSIADRVGRDITAGEELAIARETLSAIDDDGLLRLRRFALLLISGTRMPFAKSFFAWAVSSRVMGVTMEMNEAQWAVRYTDEDLEPIFIAQANEWLDSKNPLALEAAQTLARTLGSAASTDFLRAHPEEESSAWRKWREDHAMDPCTSPFAWTEADCRACMERTDIPLFRIVERVKDRVLDPAYDVPESLVKRTSEGLKSLNPLQIHAQMWFTGEMHSLDNVTPLLASRSPSSLANYIRSIFRTWKDRDVTGQRQLSYWLEEMSIVLRNDEVDAAMQVLEELGKDGPNWQAKLHGGLERLQQTAEAFVFLGLLPHLPPAEGLKRLLQRPTNALDLLTLEIWFDKADAIALHEARHALHHADDSRTLVRALWYLSKSQIALSDQDRVRITELSRSDEDIVRGATMRLACFLGDDLLGRAIVDHGQSFRSNAPTWEMTWGAEILIRYSSHLAFDAVLPRLHPSIAGFLLEGRGNKPEEITLYANVLNAGWCKIMEANDPSVNALPSIRARPEESRLHIEMPEFDDLNEGRYEWRSGQSRWGPPRRGQPSLSDALAAQDASTESMNRQIIEKVDKLYAAWGTDALEWYGRTFSPAALRAVHAAHPDAIARWIAPALRSGTAGRHARVRLGSFYAELCPLLLELDPSLGWNLWDVLQADSLGPIRFNVQEDIFTAPESAEANSRRPSAS